MEVGSIREARGDPVQIAAVDGIGCADVLGRKRGEPAREGVIGAGREAVAQQPVVDGLLVGIEGGVAAIHLDDEREQGWLAEDVLLVDERDEHRAGNQSAAELPAGIALERGQGGAGVERVTKDITQGKDMPVHGCRFDCNHTKVK